MFKFTEIPLFIHWGSFIFIYAKIKYLPTHTPKTKGDLSLQSVELHFMSLLENIALRMKNYTVLEKGFFVAHMSSKFHASDIPPAPSQAAFITPEQTQDN